MRFAKETELISHAELLAKELSEARSEIKQWEKYKRLLSGTGERLKRDVVEILLDYFALEIDGTDEGREDFKILVDGSIACMGESKGTNGGAKREHINQVDSHRERAGLGQDVPGILIINNNMDVTSVGERLKTQIAKEQIAHACAMNVLFVRTIDFLLYMRHLEPIVDRRAELLSILKGGGGWLRADFEGYELVQS